MPVLKKDIENIETKTLIAIFLYFYHSFVILAEKTLWIFT
jgi:hypothetical protein